MARRRSQMLRDAVRRILLRAKLAHIEKLATFPR
jgi:hypothetical protein